MAQHDYVIEDGTGLEVRTDLNLVLQAILTNNSSATEPTSKTAYMFWADTTTGTLKQRNAGNTAWIILMSLVGFGDIDGTDLVLDTGDQPIAGIKTFSASPIVPDPTTDQQVASKKYVDDNTVTLTGFKNHIINGEFAINQYTDIDSAPVSALTNIYNIDRNKNYISGVTATIQRLLAQTVNNRVVNTIKYVATSTASGIIGGHQYVELLYRKETKTFGAWIKSDNSNARLVIYDGVAFTSSSAHTGGGAYEFLEFAKTLPSGGTTLRCYCVIATSGLGTVSITSGEYIEFTMLQLEEGSSATDFEQRPLGLEDILCKRYYEIFYLYLLVTGSTGVAVDEAFEVEKRIAPTVTRTANHPIDSTGGATTITPNTKGVYFARAVSGMAGIYEADAEF